MTRNPEPYLTHPGNIKGLVLCGGASSRMGRDKGDLVYHTKPQKFHVAEMLMRLGLDTYISVNEDQEKTGEYQYLTDRYRHTGPLAGLLTAFEKHATAWLVVGCDYPLLETRHLRLLLSERDPRKTATVFSEETSGFLLPTLAIYEARFLPVLQSGWQSKEYSLRQLLRQRDIKILPVQDQAVRSIDTPAAYAAIKKELHEKPFRNFY